MPDVEHQVPVAAGTLTLVKRNGSTMYDLTADSGQGPVAVYLDHGANQDLMYDTATVAEALAAGTSYAGSVSTLRDPETGGPHGLLRSVLEPAGGSTYALTVDNHTGGTAVLHLGKVAAEQLLLGTAIMANHL